MKFVITWEQFKGRFEEKFILIVQKAILFKKVVNLQQGDKTVMEYVREFGTPSKYGLSFIDTLLNKYVKLVSRLKESLGRHLINHVEEQFEKLVNMALRHEIIYLESKQLVETKVESKPQINGKKKFKENKKSEEKRKSRENVKGENKKNKM